MRRRFRSRNDHDRQAAVDVRGPDQLWAGQLIGGKIVGKLEENEMEKALHPSIHFCHCPGISQPEGICAPRRGRSQHSGP